MKQYPPIHIGNPVVATGPGISCDPAGEGLPEESARIVITGASGMVGSYLLAELLGRGYRNITVTLRSLGALDKIRHVWKAEGFRYDPARLDIAPAPLYDDKALTGIFEGADVVFNCAAAVAIGGTRDGELIENNVTIARTVAAAALAARPRLLVHVSSVAALTASPTGRVDCDSKPGCEAGASGYARSKYLSELEIAKAAARGVRTVTVNPVTILGWGYKGTGSSSIIPVLASGIPFYPTGVTGWVDARDVARAMVLLTGCEGAVGRRVVLSSGNVPYKKLLADGCRAAGRKAPRIYVPEKVTRAASGAEKLWCRISRRQRLLTPEMVSILYRKHYYDGEGIKKYVNFEYSPIEATIERLVKIYLDSKQE